jgi:hypothetical protein
LRRLAATSSGSGSAVVDLMSDDDAQAQVAVPAASTDNAMVQVDPTGPPMEAPLVLAEPPSASELVLAVAKRDRKIKNLTVKNKVLGQRLRRQSLQLVAAKQQIVELRKPHDLDLVRGKCGRKLVKSGCFALAIRRNMSSISTYDIGSVLLDDVSRWT